MNLREQFDRKIRENNDFNKALKEVVKQNSSGKIWLVGGTIFRNIVNFLYNVPHKDIPDFDFIVESLNESIKTPEGFELKKTQHGNPRFISENMRVDMWSIDNSVDYPDQNKIDIMENREKLESYFRRVPLTVQAIAYDVSEGKLIGEIGMQAILNKEIKVNNINECLIFCKGRKISLRKFMRDKFKNLNFKVFYPDFREDSNKEKTNKFYKVHAKDYKKSILENYNNFIQDYLSNEFDFFINNLKGKNILDVGSGPGRDSLLLKEKGFKPICIDISEEMVKICKSKGLEAYKKDIENLDMEDNFYDGVWAYTSLLHIPKKRIYNALARISELLKPNGIIFLGMAEGEGELMQKTKNQPESERFFSLYYDEELKIILEDYFEILKSKRISVNRDSGGVYLNYVCRKLEK